MNDQMIDDLTAERAATFVVDGLRFRDLDHDGELAPYEDWRLPIERRVGDLVGRMTLEEKVGTMLHGSFASADGPLAMLGRGAAYDLDAARAQVHDRGITSMITRLATSPSRFAAQNNAVQALAAETRLGIPLTISSDPRHHAGELVGATVGGSGFTEWPATLGLAATGDRDLVQRFGDCVRREYRAVGIHMSLAPQADLGTSQRWPRFSGTFGEDPELVGALVGAYVEGVQGGRSGLSPESVACVVKHWVGYGASRDGFDGHNYYGRFSAFPAGAFDDHVAAFGPAFDIGAAGVMPTYNILEGVELDGDPLEAVGAGFSRQLIEGLLRGRHGYRGLVLSDWAITRDCSEACRTGDPSQGPAQIAMCWGVEELSRAERFAKCVNAGVDQIGGEEDPEPLLAAIRSGLIDVARVDDAVRRILTVKFELGLFEQPFVDPGAAGVGGDDDAVTAAEAQQRSVVVLAAARQPMVVDGDVVFSEGEIAAELAARGITTTDDLTAATRAVVTTSTPHELLHPGHFFGRLHHEGDLSFDPNGDEWKRLEAVMAAVPTVVVVDIDRPPILTPFVDRADAIVAVFGVPAGTIADVVTGRAPGTGRLPFRLFRSMDDVIASPCDRPGADNVLYPAGASSLA